MGAFLLRGDIRPRAPPRANGWLPRGLSSRGLHHRGLRGKRLGQTLLNRGGGDGDRFGRDPSFRLGLVNGADAHASACSLLRQCGRGLAYRRRRNKNSISCDNVNHIYKDTKNTFWIATNDGLNKFDFTKKQFYAYTEKDGLLNSYIYAALPDNEPDRGTSCISLTRQPLASQSVIVALQM